MRRHSAGAPTSPLDAPAVVNGPVIHIGFPKAASSFLQEIVFPEVEGYDYISEKRRVRDLSKRYWFEYDDEFGRDFDLDANLILSREHLLAPAYSMLETELYQHRNMSMANLIHFFRDKGTILVVLRRQDSLIESLVKFKSSFFHSGRTIFLDFATDGPWLHLGDRLHSMLLQSFDFCAVLSQLAGVVGRDRVKLLFYEDLVRQPALFMTQLGEIFEQDLGRLAESAERRVNASPATSQLGNPVAAGLNRRLNGKLSRWLPRRPVALADDTRRRLLAIYAPGNEKLFRWFGLENRHGYY